MVSASVCRELVAMWRDRCDHLGDQPIQGVSELIFLGDQMYMSIDGEHWRFTVCSTTSRGNSIRMKGTVLDVIDHGGRLEICLDATAGSALNACSFCMDVVA